MARNILFRGKRTDNGGWAYGYYIKANYRWHKYGFHADWIATASFANSGWFALAQKFPVRSETVGQYTGLNDKNDKQVFEGDILRIARKSDGLGDYYFPPLEYPVPVVVKWDLCAWMWETRNTDKYYISFPSAWCHFECEVIGNIFDNPELLPKEES